MQYKSNCCRVRVVPKRSPCAGSQGSNGCPKSLLTAQLEFASARLPLLLVSDNPSRIFKTSGHKPLLGVFSRSSFPDRFSRASYYNTLRAFQVIHGGVPLRKKPRGPHECHCAGFGPISAVASVTVADFQPQYSTLT